MELSTGLRERTESAMDKAEIEAYLLEVDEALARAFPSKEPIRVLVVGGACLLLAGVTRRVTSDIDVIITDLEGTGEASLVYQLTPTTKRMRKIISAVGKRRGLPSKERMVLNDDCALFLLDMGFLPQAQLFQAYRKLHVYLPADLGYILGCKLMAARPSKDEEDIQVLCQRLGIYTRRQAQALLNRYFPNPGTQLLHQAPQTLDRLFSNG